VGIHWKTFPPKDEGISADAIWGKIIKKGKRREENYGKKEERGKMNGKG
jgi:hypothetical protein